MWVGSIEKFWIHRITQDKSAILTKILNYTNFSCICIKMLQYSHDTYCLQEQWTHFGLRVLTHFSLPASAQFGIENQKQKVNDIYKCFLNYMNFSWIILCGKLSWNPNYLLLDPILSHYLLQLIHFWLSLYYSHYLPGLRSNLKLKKLLRFV